MNITQEQTGDLTATIKIELVPEDYQEKVKTVLKDYQKKANMPGFRPGKVPFGMINKMYGKPVLVEEINKIVSESLNTYIIDEKINILGSPLANMEKQQPIDFDKEIDMNFYFDIGIIPEINLVIDENIKMDFYDIQADKKTADKFIIDIQKRQGQPEAVEISEEEDIIRGEISDPDEEIAEDAEPKITTISASFIKKKSEKSKFIGVKVDDIISFNPLKATDNATEASHITGVDKNDKEKLDKNYNLKVTEISRIKPAELNEEFFNKVFPRDKIKTKEEFETRILEEAKKDFVIQSDKKLMNDFQDKMIEETNLSLPDEFLKKWLLESQEGKLTKEEVDKEFDTYAKALKWQLLEGKIITDLGIKVEEKDARDHIKQYFLSQMAIPGDNAEADSQLEGIVDSVMQNKEELKQIYDTLMHNKVKDIVKEKIKLENKNITYEDFIKLVNNN